MTGGNPQSLARAEREVGLDSWSVSLYPSRARYEADEVIDWGKAGPLRMELARWPLLWRALRSYDVIHFNFGASLMPYWNSADSPAFKPYSMWIRKLYGLYARCLELRDVPLLRKAGKGIVVTYQGDDARQGDYCRDHFEISPAVDAADSYYNAESDRRKRKRITRFARYADRVYALNPDLLHVLPEAARFMPYATVDLRKWKPDPSRGSTSDVPLVLHAPTRRDIKGTSHVTAAFERLEDEGVKFKYVVVENMSRAEARILYEKADLLIDQLLAGWYGGLAVELMALGKPVICYIRKGDLKFIPTAMREELPVIEATPATIYETLKQWLTSRRRELGERGARSRSFVETWHDPLKIAEGLRIDYEAIMRQHRKGRQQEPTCQGVRADPN